MAVGRVVVVLMLVGDDSYQDAVVVVAVVVVVEEQNGVGSEVGGSSPGVFCHDATFFIKLKFTLLRSLTGKKAFFFIL